MDLPIVVYILPPIVIAMLVYTVVIRRRGMAATTHATLGALAQRLGLQLVEGDPGLNLYYLSQPSGSYERSLRLQGTPYGRRVDWDFTDGTRRQDFIVLVRTTHTWGCYLVAHLQHPVPQFEASPRSPTNYLEPDLQLAQLPEVSSGDPTLDATYRITAADPGVGPAAAAALRVLSDQLYVHVLGKGKVVMIPITRYGLSYFVHAAEQYLYALECVACALEGRQAPAMHPVAATA